MSTPANHNTRHIPGHRRRGLSIVEVLISLAISAMLLTAVTAAFSASASSVENNDQFFRATQAARVTLHHLLSQIRRGAINETSTATNLNLITAEEADGTGEEDRTYKYVSAEKKVKMVIHDGDNTTVDPEYTLCSNVSDARFDVELGTDSNNAQCVARVAVTIAVKVGKSEIRLSGSASPRRNLVY